MTLSAITAKAKEIAKGRVSSDFAFSVSWFYGFCKFFRISCRIAAESAGSDRLEIDELQVNNLFVFIISPFLFSFFHFCLCRTAWMPSLLARCCEMRPWKRPPSEFGHSAFQ